MARQSTTEFLAAFAVGTALGIGATLLLKPEPRTAKERLMRELKPYRRKMRRSVGQVARGVDRGRQATGDVADDAIDAGRELIAEFRDEVRRIVAEARDELVEALEARQQAGPHDEKATEAPRRGARRSKRNMDQG
jgi:hypothetical protein